VTDSISLENAETANDDAQLEQFGYRQTLKRSMGWFSSFAVSFSFISITTGIFANYGFGIDHGGSRFLWTWILVGIGQTLVALCLANLAPRVPLAGAMYNWGAKLMSRRYGWLTGWFVLAGYLAGYAGVAYAFSSYFAPYVGIGSSTHVIVLTTVVLIAIVGIINIAGMTWSSRINNISVVTEIVGITAVGIGLLIYVLVAGKSHTSYLSSNVGLASSGSSIHTGFSGLSVAILMGAYTLIGFECAADLSEETKGAVRRVPRSIISSVVISAVLGFFVLLGFTLAIPNLHAVETSGTPLLVIMQYYLGPVATKLAMAMVFISIFACTLMNTATPARQLFAISRDGMIPPKERLVHVSRRSKSPYVAIIVVSVIAILFTLIAKVEAVITSVSSVAIYLGYGLVIIAGLINRQGLKNPAGSFNLNRWHKPVSIAAIVWLVVAIVAMTLPAPGHNAAYVALAVVAIGVGWYLLYVRRLPDEREAMAVQDRLDASPAAIDATRPAAVDTPDAGA
jgi:amino acid transporter